MDEIVKMENNKNVKRMIFHIPVPLQENPVAASGLRPIKMIEAFRSLGYEVDIVAGGVKERKQLIHEVKNKIREGWVYDFCYSESSTVPTALTEKGRFVPRPFLDFNFFKFLKNNSVPIGLFYRDVRWMFPKYEEIRGYLKRFIAKIFYKYDLLQYKKHLDVLFLPSIKMKEYIPVNFNDKKTIALPPGCDILPDKRESKILDKITMIYVGGIRAPFYDISNLLKFVMDKDNVEIILICRENEYQETKGYYKFEALNNIKIFHCSGEKLKEFLNVADVFAIIWEPIEYLSFAMPYKLFEAISYDLPVLTVKGTATSKFVSENNIGWVSDKDFKDFSIDKIRNELAEKTNNIKNIKSSHMWINRAELVKNSLFEE